MNQLTIRGVDRELEQCIRQLASREGISLNQAVLKLLRRGAGLVERHDGSNAIGTSLDHLIGTWTDREAAEMNSTLEDFSKIDDAMWCP